MLKDVRKYKDLVFQPVLSGGLSCLHRPTKGGIYTIRQTQCTAIITLLAESENPNEIGNVCKELGFKWTWVPLQGANKRLLESNNTSWIIRKALDSAKRMLESGEFIFVHCAAGIHRTGIFLYALLRISGFNKDDTLEKIRQIRTVTWEKCGTSRFELAESLSTQMMSENWSFVRPEFQGLTPTKTINSPLFWVKITPTHIGNLRFEVVITNTEVTEYILGPCLNLKIKFEYVYKVLGESWLRAREVKFLPGGISKNFKFFEKELLSFIKESCPLETGQLIGKEVYWELQFIQAFWPEVSKVFTNGVIDLHDIPDIVRNTQNESVCQDILEYKACLQS